jgi:hypothetical protein
MPSPSQNPILLPNPPNPPKATKVAPKPPIHTTPKPRLPKPQPKLQSIKKSFTHGEAIANCIKVQTRHDFFNRIGISKATSITNIYPKNNYCHIHEKVYRRDYPPTKLTQETLCMVPLNAKSDLAYLAKIADKAINKKHPILRYSFFFDFANSKLDNKRSFYYDRYCLSYDYTDKEFDPEVTIKGKYKSIDVWYTPPSGIKPPLPLRPNQQNNRAPSPANPLKSVIIPVSLHTRILPKTPQTTSRYTTNHPNPKTFPVIPISSPNPIFTTPLPFKIVKKKLPPSKLLNKIKSCTKYTHTQDVKIFFMSTIKLIIKVSPKNKYCSLSFKGQPKAQLKKGQTFTAKDMKCLIPKVLLKKNSPVLKVLSSIIPRLTNPNSLLDVAKSTKANPSIIAPLMKYCKTIDTKFTSTSQPPL